MNLSPAFFDHVAVAAKIFGASVLLIAFALSWRFVCRRAAHTRQRVADHLAKNPALDPAAFAATYFPADEVAVARRLRELLVPHLDLDLSRLHPDDHLVEDLRIDDLDGLSTVEFILAVEKEFAIQLPRAEIARILTLRELTACVSRLLATRPEAASRPGATGV